MGVQEKEALSMKLEDLTPAEKELLAKKFAQFPRLPKESNNICPNYYNPYHDQRECPGSCRYCMWDGVLREMGV